MNFSELQKIDADKFNADSEQCKKVNCNFAECKAIDFTPCATHSTLCDPN